MSEDETFELISLDSIADDSDFRYRTSLGDISGLAESIDQNGQQVPIIVRRIPGSDKVQLISGFRRRAAMTKLGREKIQARILDENTPDQHAIRVSLLENLQRKSLTSLDVVMTAEKLRESGMMVKEIAEAFGVSTRTIQRYFRVAKAPEEFRRALDREDVTVLQVYEALNKGVPVEELLGVGRSVSYLRSLARERDEETEEGRKKKKDVSFQIRKNGKIAFSLKYDPSSSDKERLVGEVRRLLDALQAVEDDDDVDDPDPDVVDRT